MKYLLVFLLSSILIRCSPFVGFRTDQAVVVNGASGFKIAKYVVTANHVADQQIVIIKEESQKTYFGIVVARDTINDIALILGDTTRYWNYETSTAYIGQEVFTISNPGGLDFSRISGEVQNVERKDLNGAINVQVGIDVYWGSSGSAIYDHNGQLLGMIIKAVPGTRFAFMVPANKIILLIQKNKGVPQ